MTKLSLRYIQLTFVVVFNQRDLAVLSAVKL